MIRQDHARPSRTCSVGVILAVLSGMMPDRAGIFAALIGIMHPERDPVVILPELDDIRKLNMVNLNRGIFGRLPFDLIERLRAAAAGHIHGVELFCVGIIKAFAVPECIAERHLHIL